MSNSTFCKTTNTPLGEVNEANTTDYVVEALNEHIQDITRSEAQALKDLRNVRKLNKDLKKENKALQAKLNANNNPTVQPIKEWLLQLTGTLTLIYFIGFCYEFLF